MKFEQFYSSSSGNLYTVTASNGGRILLECGVTWKKLQRALNYDLSNIDAAIISHEHKDHSAAIRDVMRAGIDVYMSEGTAKTLDVIDERRIPLLLENKTRVKIGTFEVFPFALNHDAAEPLGFIIHCDKEDMLFAPDTSHITQRFGLALSIIALECSYDINVLQGRVDNLDIIETLAKRLLTSHMELQTTKKYLREFCDLSRCREIQLLHLSRDNIDAEKARKEVEDEFFIETVIV